MHLLKFGFLPLLALLVESITHQRSLIWTMKSHDPATNPFDIIGILGDPTAWVHRGFTDYSYSYFGAYELRNSSKRSALAFDYANKRLFFADNGFRAVFKTTVQEASASPFVYNSSMSGVYTQTSNGVQALAYDWASGSLYWVDSIFNIIKVANSDLLNIARTIISDDLQSPNGIAVYPSQGLMYWTNKLGPRIEHSTLDGTGRKTLVEVNLVDPTALSLDQSNNILYFLDAGKQTVEKIDLGTNARFEAAVRGNPVLSGLSHFSSYVFIADQRTECIEVLNKTNFDHVTNIEAGLHWGEATPYDVRMYDPSLQMPFFSDCSWLKCEHICVSGGGQKGRCICADGFQVSPTDSTKCLKPSGCDQLQCEFECVLGKNDRPRCVCQTPMQLHNDTHCAEPKSNQQIIDPPSSLPIPAIIIIVISAVLLLIVSAVILLLLLLRRRRNKRKPDLTPSVSYRSDTSDTTTIVKTYVCRHDCQHRTCEAASDLNSPEEWTEPIPLEPVYSEIIAKEEGEAAKKKKVPTATLR